MIRAVSKKRAALNRQRGAVVAALREDQTWCARCGQNTLTDGHERLGRVHGGDIVHPDDLLCRPCNSWAEDNPRRAAFDGWKISGKHDRDPLLQPGEARDNLGDVVKTRGEFADVKAESSPCSDRINPLRALRNQIQL